MRLNELTDASYSRKKRLRVGRGIGSGKGKTCGAGHKGQKSRSGVSVNGFEGGQMPIYRRVPKRGFVNPNRFSDETINLGKLQELIDSKKISAKDLINKDLLVKLKLVKSERKLKILAKGEIKVALRIEADAASKSAILAVQKAGGELTIKKQEAEKTAADLKPAKLEKKVAKVKKAEK